MTKIKICPPISQGGQEITVLRDIGGPGDRSITNDIESVVDQVLHLSHPYFFYYDSSGDLTGVSILNNKFQAFFHPNALMRDTCVEPDAKWMACCVCDRPVKTCERHEPVNESYMCPVHENGAELSDGRWVCSDECGDRIVTLGDDQE